MTCVMISNNPSDIIGHYSIDSSDTPLASIPSAQSPFEASTMQKQRRNREGAGKCVRYGINHIGWLTATRQYKQLIVHYDIILICGNLRYCTIEVTLRDPVFSVMIRYLTVVIPVLSVVSDLLTGVDDLLNEADDIIVILVADTACIFVVTCSVLMADHSDDTVMTLIHF